MRRTMATLLIAGLLGSFAPFAPRDRGEDPGFNPIKIIKKIVKKLVPSPTDGGDVVSPPKP